jgi:hypothetical protein
MVDVFMCDLTSQVAQLFDRRLQFQTFICILVVRGGLGLENTIFSSSVNGGFGSSSFTSSDFDSSFFDCSGFLGAIGFLMASFALGLKVPKMGDGANVAPVFCTAWLVTTFRLTDFVLAYRTDCKVGLCIRRQCLRQFDCITAVMSLTATSQVKKPKSTPLNLVRGSSAIW